MDLGQVTQRLTRRCGPGVADWCAGIPALADVFARRWDLVPGGLFPSGNSSVAIRCTRSDGSGAVLLELIEPGTQASELQPPPSAPDWAALLAALHIAPVRAVLIDTGHGPLARS